MMIRHRKFMAALGCLLGFSLCSLFMVAFLHHLDKPGGRIESVNDILFACLALVIILITAPQLLKPCIVRLTPEFLEISRTLTLYRIPWAELDDVEVVAKGHLPFMKITTNPPRSTWLAGMDRKHSRFDIGVNWWEVAVPMRALAKLLWLYAADAAAREELRDPARVAERLAGLRKRA